MAAVANVQTVNITINDLPLQVPKGELIVESVKRLGLEVPIFCYHPRMKPVGMCRMCLVEIGFKQPDGTVRKMPKPQTACSLPASEGLAIYTDTELIHTDRRGVLEFLLVNHPLDCPVCDRGGECPLQNNTLYYGPSTSRFVELKRHAPKAFPLSKYVKLDLERCIQCGRCVRFTEEISGDAQLAFRFRGARMQPSTFGMAEFESKFSGNVIEICPVGALTSAQYRFRARPWDLQSRPSICTLCSNGCNVHVDYRVDRVVRVNGRTNEAVNEEWTCDKGKFGHDIFNSTSRIEKPLVRNGNSLTPSTWSEAYDQIIQAFTAAGPSVAVIGGSTSTNEDLYSLTKLFRSTFGSNNVDHRFTKSLPSQSFTKQYGIGQVSTPIASIEDQQAVFVFGTALSDELPIVFLRLRKAWFKHGTKVVVAHHETTDADSFAHVILRYRPGSEAAVLAGLTLATGVVGADPTFTPEYVESVSGVKAGSLIEAAEILKDSKAPVISTRSLYNLESSESVVSALVGFAKGVDSPFNLYGLNSNDQGASELGVVPFDPQSGEKAGLDTHEILTAAAKGQLKALWLLGDDPFSLHPDPSLVRKALENVPFLVVQTVSESESTSYASVVLPLSSPLESEGTYTNVERRVQRAKQVLPTRGESKPAWRVFEEIAMRIKPQTPLFNPSDILKKISQDFPPFATDLLSSEGALLS
jgi:NADH-quinone oxidoreductase subunit G